VEISGEAYCEWTEGSKNKTTYSGNETYLKERTYLVGGREGEVTVQPGHYSYNFSCNLPPNLPTTVDAEFGYIRYMAKVVLDIPLWPDKEFEKVFKVVQLLNLNSDPSLKLPAIREQAKRFNPCCLFFCCQSEPMQLVARVPVVGYIPGQTINVEFEVDNKSNNQALFNVNLWRKITFHTHTNSKKQKEEIFLVSGLERIGHVHQKSTESFRAALLIPPTSPSDFDVSNICKVRYVLRVTGKVPGCHKDAEVELPIVIGTYPFLDDQSKQGYYPEQSGSYNFPVNTGTGPTVGFNAPSAPAGYPTPNDPLLPSNQNAASLYPNIHNSTVPPFPLEEK